MADDVITTLPLVNESEETQATMTSLYDFRVGGLGLGICPEADGNVTDSGFYQTAQLVTGLFIYPAFCFPGLVGNILTVVVLSQRNMLNSTNAFLSALAVSDSIKLVNDILYFFVTLFLNTDSVLGNLSYGYLYPYAHFIFNMSVCVSSWLTVSVAVERYILVCHPTKARNIWTRKMAVGLCAVVYVVMTSLALPSAFRYRTIECFDRALNTSRLEVELTELWQNETFVTSYTWAQNLIRSIIPLFVLVALNACIIRAVRRTKVRKRKNSRHRVTIMMIVVILTFLVCITPDAILSTVFGRGYHEAGNVTKGIREITDTLLTINAAINFVIYCALNRVFRKSFAHLCCPRKKKDNGWVTEMDESVYRRLSEAKTSLFSNNNHSNPRQDTSSLRRDASPNSSPERDSSCFASAPPSPSTPTFYSGKNSNFSSASPDLDNNARWAASGDVPGSNRPKSLLYHKNFSHPNRGSSQGLKRCRNSVKTSRGKRAASGGKTGVGHISPKETVTYIPTTECVTGTRGGFRRSHAPWKVDGARNKIDREDPVSEAKSESTEVEPDSCVTKNAVSGSRANSYLSSPLSAVGSPATTDSEVFYEDRLYNDVTTNVDDDLTPHADDVSMTSPMLVDTKDAPSKVIENDDDDCDNDDDDDVDEDDEQNINYRVDCSGIESDRNDVESLSSSTHLSTNDDSQPSKVNGTSNKARKALTVSFSQC